MWRIIKPPTTSMPKAVQSILTPSGVVHRMLISFGIDDIESESQHDRETGEHPSCHAPLCCVDRDLPLEAEPFPDDMGGLVENLGQISPALLLDHDRGCDNAEILEGNAIDHVVQGGLHLQPIVLLLEARLEFAADGIGAFTRHRAHRGDKAVSGAQRAHHQIQRLRQSLLKVVEALAALEQHPAKGRCAQRASPPPKPPGCIPNFK